MYANIVFIYHCDTEDSEVLKGNIYIVVIY